MTLNTSGLKQVAEFTPQRNPITTRTPRNPLDKCTIVSIFPKAIREVKHTIQPGIFEIPKGTKEEPALLVIGTSSWWKAFGDHNQPTLEIPVSSIAIAESIVKDYANGMLGCDMVDSMPGLFWIPGEVTLEKVKSDYSESIEAAYRKQRNWYTILVRLADSLWARSNGNPLTISEEMRLAARELGFGETKPWMKDLNVTENMVNCPACGTLKYRAYPICPTCKAIDPSHPSSQEIKFAGSNPFEG